MQCGCDLTGQIWIRGAVWTDLKLLILSFLFSCSLPSPPLLLLFLLPLTPSFIAILSLVLFLLLFLFTFPLLQLLIDTTPFLLRIYLFFPSSPPFFFHLLLSLFLPPSDSRWHFTPLSSACLQLCVPTALALQFSRRDSFPTHLVSSRKMGILSAPGG